MEMDSKVENAIKNTKEDMPVEYPAIPDWQQLIYSELVLIRECNDRILHTIDLMAEQSRKK